MNYNSANYIANIAESKQFFHRRRSKLAYEEKVKIIIELQKIEMEMIRSNGSRSNTKKFIRVWEELV